MIKNKWKNTRFFCMNHAEPVELYAYLESNTPFYACPRYFLRDEKHPDGHGEDEKQCLNRLSTTLAWNIIEQVSKLVEDARDNFEFIDFSNYTFNYKGFEITILELNEASRNVRIGIGSQKEAANWMQR